MTHLPEPKDGNRGKKRPVLPVAYVETLVKTTEHIVTTTVVFQDAEGDRFHQIHDDFYFDLEHVKPENNSEQG